MYKNGQGRTGDNKAPAEELIDAATPANTTFKHSESTLILNGMKHLVVGILQKKA